MSSEEYVLVLDVKALQLKHTWITAVATYRENETPKIFLGDVLFELQERVERDANDGEAWVLKSAVQATLESVSR